MGKMLVVITVLGMLGLVGSLEVLLPSTLEVFELELLNLTCNATDYPQDAQLTYVWRKLSSSVTLPPGPSLVLAPIQLEDDGSYECQVSTDSSVKANKTVRITVQYLPRWKLLTVNKFAGVDGQNAVLNCITYSFPLPLFYWMNPQGSNITSSTDYTVATSDSTSTLSIKSVKQSDYGDYTCVAYNTAGAGKFHLPLQVPGKPDSPLQCLATDVQSKSASLDCVPGFNGGQSELRYSVTKESPGSSGPATAKSSFHTGKGGVVVIVVEELSPKVNYTLKISAENDHGTSDVSFGVLVWTPTGGNELSPLLRSVVIGVSVGGGALIILLLILVIICCVKCRRRKKNKPASGHQVKSTSNLADEGGPFRAIRDVQHGNPSTKSTTTRQTFGQENQTNGSRVLPFSLNLNHAPGESCDGYDNAAYAGNMNLDRSGCSADRNLANNEHMNGRSQPPLAGYGAMRNMIELPAFEKPKVGARRCSIPVPPFQPDVPWEYPRERLYIRNKLGEGCYGEVWQAKAEDILGRPGQRMVAVKMLRDEYSADEQQYLQKDLEVMKLLQPHPNIILLLGCCTRSSPLCLILELATNGNLLNLLRQQRHAFSLNNLDEDSPSATRKRHVNLTMQDLIKFALQVASGMDYIASKQLIHRDLAARNVLLDEQMICKISDFGAIDDIAEVRQYESKTKRRLPLRWMAPESLTISEYSVRTDVWSFGVLVWEIIALGSTPYPGLSGPQAMELVQKGSHMIKPSLCSDALYGIMKACWRFYPNKRPSFSALKEKLNLLAEQSPDNCIYVDQLAENTYEILHHQPGEKC